MDSSEEGNAALRLVAIAALPRLVLAFIFAGTEDVGLFQRIAGAMMRGQNPYRVVDINWPPLWAVLTDAAQRLAFATLLPFTFTVKWFPIAADVLITLVLFSQARRRWEAEPSFRFALLYALNPLAIYITAVHGQFDAIPACALLLAAVFLSRDEGGAGWKTSASWLALGIMAKTWPLFVLPALAAVQRPFRRKIAYCAIATLPAVLVMSVLWTLSPKDISEKVLHYRGAGGWWGFSGVATLLHGNDISQGAFSALFYSALTLTAAAILRRRDPARGSLLMLLAFLFFTPGFGDQYLLWLLPVALLVDQRTAMIYTVLAGATVITEAILRPFNGTFGQMLQLVPPHSFHAAYGLARDHDLTVALRIPVWLFSGGWWLTELLRRSPIRRAKGEE
jgi:hypothetical protein